MRHSLLTAGLLLFLTFQSCWININTFDVSKDFLIGCETGKNSCRPIETKRQSHSEKLTVHFSISAISTDINLYDSTYLTQIAKKTSTGSIKPLRAGFISVEDKPSLDLTGLPDGRYYVHILGEDVGGVFQLNIETER